MGVDTKGYLNKKVTAKEVYDVIVTKFDKEAEFNVKYDDTFQQECGFIYFNYNEDRRGLFFSGTCNNEEFREKDLEEDKEVRLILGLWNNSEIIMSEIVKCFGGYVDDNDCDEIDMYYVPKDDNFKYDEYINQRNQIENILSENLDSKTKINIANEILKNKDRLKEILNNK